VVCRNTIWTAWLVVDLTKQFVFHVKTSTLIEDIEQSLTNIKYNIDKVIKNREQNLSEIRQQRQIFHEQIKQMRVKIKSHDKSPTQSLWFVEMQSGQQGLSWC
jgi:hypothetical protein